MENRRSHEGFALLEVVVALALLSVAALGIAATLEAALRALGTAESARRALAAAEAAAHTAISPTPGWEPASAGPGGPVAGEAGPAPPCSRRVSRGTGPSDWLWIEVRCGPDLGLPGASPSAAGSARLAVPR